MNSTSTPAKAPATDVAPVEALSETQTTEAAPAKAELKPAPYASLVDTAKEALFAVLKTVQSRFDALDAARDKFAKWSRDHMKVAAKYVAALKAHHASGLDSGEIPPGTAFKAWYKANVGGNLPGRLESMAALFNRLVLTMGDDGKPLMPETNYDLQSNNALEKANAEVSAALKKYGDAWKASPEIQQLLDILNGPGDAAKRIDDLRKVRKGARDETPSADAPALTVNLAVAFLESAIRSAQPDADGKALFYKTVNLGNLWADSAIPEETLNQWGDDFDSGVAAHLTVLKPETPAVEHAPAEAVAA